jgi:glycosyltransferase involved in cell wall biosynthesis
MHDAFLKNKKIVFIVNVDWFFVSHRLPIALEAIKKGCEVHVITTVTNKLKLLKKSGIIVHDVSISRSRSNILIFSEFIVLMSIIRGIAPDIVHLVTIKPVLLGGVSARLIGVPAVVSAISGLGSTFHMKGIIPSLKRKIIILLYYLSFGHKNQKVIFQNNDDKLRLTNIRKDINNRSTLIPGSGVDTSLYSVLENDVKSPIVMMASRLLSSKGVEEFVQAAKIVKIKNKNVRFVLVGDIDPSNPESIKKSRLSQWKEDESVEIWGYRDDMHNVIPRASIFVFPSYYGEGLPKVLSEAAACGCAIITTDHPGCRDAVEPDTGILVPIKDSVSLANAIEILLQNPKKIEKMGRAGRKLAEKKFSIESVCEKHMMVYQELLTELN